jgi:hypothetical protein
VVAPEQAARRRDMRKTERMGEDNAVSGEWWVEDYVKKRASISGINLISM